MKRTDTLIKRLFVIDNEINELIRELDKRIESKLGEGWGITQQTDGLCLIDIHCNNYALSERQLISLLRLSRDEALNAVERYGI